MAFKAETKGMYKCKNHKLQTDEPPQSQNQTQLKVTTPQENGSNLLLSDIKCISSEF